MLMEHDETTSFVPVISRLERLDHALQLLEDKQRLSKKDMFEAESKNECKTLSSALEEVQHKGTLLERLTLLEKRVLELSLEIDEGNTSKSSSSTIEVSEMTSMKDSESSIPSGKDEHGVKVTTKEMLHPPTIQEQERASTDGLVKEKTDEQKSRGKKKISQKKWLWLLRLRC